MSFRSTREIRIQDDRSLLERGWDFGFGSFFPGGLLGGLPSGAQTIIQSILDSPAPPVISEIPQTWEELEREMPELFEPILETRPGRVADSYPQDVSDDIAPDDDEVSHTWGHLALETVGGLIGGWVGTPDPVGLAPPQARDAFLSPSTPSNQLATAAAMAGCDGMAWSGAAPPKGYKVVNHCGVAVLRKIRRRRRPRIATNSDLADISAIVGIVGKGQLATALISRRGR